MRSVFLVHIITIVRKKDMFLAGAFEEECPTLTVFFLDA